MQRALHVIESNILATAFFTASFVNSCSLSSLDMKGDVRVLRRIEKHGRRMDRASSRIANAMKKKARGPSKKMQWVENCALPPMPFSKRVDIIVHESTAASKRRIFRKRIEKKHAFYLGEVVRKMESVLALVVAPAHEGASPRILAKTITSKQEWGDMMAFSVSEACVPILKARGFETIDTGVHRGTHVCARKVHFEDGQFVFYLTIEDPECSSAPWALGIDSAIYKRLQTTACSMFGLCLQTCQETLTKTS